MVNENLRDSQKEYERSTVSSELALLLDALPFRVVHSEDREFWVEWTNGINGILPSNRQEFLLYQILKTLIKIRISEMTQNQNNAQNKVSELALLLCPFCGSDKIEYITNHVKIKNVGTRYSHFYKCKICSATIKGRDQFDALNKWNQRA